MHTLTNTILQAIAHSTDEDKAAIREELINADPGLLQFFRTHSTLDRDLFDGLEEMLDICDEELG